MKRNRSNNSNMLVDNVDNNLVRIYYLENNLNMKNVSRKDLTFREFLVYFFTSICAVEPYRVKQDTGCGPSYNVLVRDTGN